MNIAFAALPATDPPQPVRPSPKPAPPDTPVMAPPATPPGGAAALAARPVWQGVALLALLALLLWLWGQLAPLTAAHTLTGTVILRDGPRVIAHPTGGRVAALLVAEGDAVAAGAPLLRLHDPALEAEVARLTEARAQAAAQVARLRALLDPDTPTLPVPAATDDPTSLAVAAADAIRVRDAADQHRFATEAAGARAASAALAAQARAVADQIALIEGELANQSVLLDRGLTQAARVAALRREAARLRGLEAEIAGTRARLATQADLAGAEANRLAAGRLAETHEALLTASARKRDLALAHAALDERVAGLLLTAPVAGRVAALSVAGPGAVLPPGAEAMRILPNGAARAVAVAVPAARVSVLTEQIAPGQGVRLLHDDAARRTPREMPATVLAVAPALAAQAAPRQGGAGATLTIVIAPDDPAALDDALPLGAPVRVVFGLVPGRAGAFAALGATLHGLLTQR